MTSNSYIKKNRGQVIMIGVIILSVVLLNVLDSHSNCSYQKKKLRISYSGIVTNKLLDKKNHMTRTLILNNTYKIIFNREKSGFYEFINVGDSISKKTGEFNIEVYRGELVYNKILKYPPCE